MGSSKLDALLFPGGSGAGIAARAGLPDGDRAVRLRARMPPPVPRGFQGEGQPVRGELHRDRVH